MPLALCWVAWMGAIVTAQADLEPPATPPETAWERFEISIPSMGSHLDMVVYAPNQQTAQKVMEAGLDEVERLVAVLSNYHPNSEISRLCASPPNQRFEVSEDLARVIMHSRRWHAWSNGKFDITVGPLTQLWRNSRKRKELPGDSEIAEAKLRCGWDAVETGFEQGDAPKWILLREPGMILDLSGIAVGYIVDRAFEKMVNLGPFPIMINAGGDIRVGQPPVGKEGWKITVSGLGKDSPPIANLILKDCAVTTSGDLVQFVEIDGRRYSHFIDPDLGAPIERRQSVTAIATTTVDADAGATALAVLGMDQAMESFDAMPVLEAIAIEAAKESGQPIRMRYFKK
jgi:FAD:protein FMN transferase